MECSLVLGVILSLLFPIHCEVFSALRKNHGLRTSSSGKISEMVDIVEGYHPEAIMTAMFNNTINQTGWSFLDLRDTRTGNEFQDEQIAGVAGFLEGNITAPLIYMHWQNTFAGYCDGKKDFCTKLYTFIDKNIAYCTHTLADREKSESYQAYLWYAQLQGLYQGYSYSGYPDITSTDFLLMQLFGDLEDLESALGGGGNNSRVTGSGSCSALIKLLPDHSELYVAHDTWGDYNAMLRIFKRYQFNFAISSTQADEVIPGNIQVFSSYPGVLHSGDDYYLLSSGLVTMETTIGNNNPDLWQYVTAENLFEPVRVVVANRLATNGQQWAAYFSEENMGTYNNQWMVVDYKLFVPGEESLRDGLLWVVEQLPGLMKSSDMTEILRKTSYWPSFNIPWFPEIYNLSMTNVLAEQYGEWFTWHGSPRFKIFDRNNTGISDLQSMIALMRYNNFQHDDLSRCACSPPYSGENAISARSDLNPVTGTYPFSALQHRRHGGTDMKVTSLRLFGSLSCVAVSGPTSDQEPMFQWSTSGFTPIPMGHPDTWDFKPLTIEWNIN